MSPYRDFQILTASTMFEILKCRAGKILLLKRLCKKVLKNAYFLVPNWSIYKGGLLSVFVSWIIFIFLSNILCGVCHDLFSICRIFSKGPVCLSRFIFIFLISSVCLSFTIYLHFIYLSSLCLSVTIFFTFPNILWRVFHHTRFTVTEQFKESDKDKLCLPKKYPQTKSNASWARNKTLRTSKNKHAQNVFWPNNPV